MAEYRGVGRNLGVRPAGRITNEPVGSTFRRRRAAAPAAAGQERDVEMEPADGPGVGSMRNARPTSRPARARPAPRDRELSADELNDMVLNQLAGRRPQLDTMREGQVRDNIDLAMSRDLEPERGTIQREALRRGGPVKMASGGKVRGDGVCSRGKTKGRYI